MSAEKKSGYECFDELILQLRAEGFDQPAAKLHTLLNETAWTTSSELLGELGLVMVAFEESRPAVSDPLRACLGACMNIVRRVRPRIAK